jgi:hypothetical protein
MLWRTGNGRNFAVVAANVAYGRAGSSTWCGGKSNAKDRGLLRITPRNDLRTAMKSTVAFEALLQSKDETIAVLVQSKQEMVQELVQSKQELVQSNQKLVQELVQSKQEMVQSKQELIQSQAKLIAVLEEKSAGQESELLAHSSKYASVFTMRPFVELGLFALWKAEGNGEKRSATWILQEFFMNLFRQGANEETIKSDIRDLGESETLRNVLGDAPQLYSNLSRPFHGSKALHLKSGLIVGGELPVRLTCATVILFLQRRNCLPYEFIYTDEAYNPKFWLSNGVIKSYSK